MVDGSRKQYKVREGFSRIESGLVNQVFKGKCISKRIGYKKIEEYLREVILFRGSLRELEQKMGCGYEVLGEHTNFPAPFHICHREISEDALITNEIESLVENEFEAIVEYQLHVDATYFRGNRLNLTYGRGIPVRRKR